MDVTVPVDPLEQEIFNLEALISQETAEISALLKQHEDKRQELDRLTIEARTLRRAAVLRPMPAAAIPVGAGISAAGGVPPVPPAPGSAQQPTGRPRGIFGQIRTNDPRLPVLPGG